jgi:hypothetical protein
MQKFIVWGKNKYPNIFTGINGISQIGYMIEYLSEIYQIHEFNFSNFTVYQILDYLYDEIDNKEKNNG